MFIDSRIGCQEPLGVGQQHQQVCMHKVSYKRSDAIIVTEPDRVVSNRIVLVDDGQDTKRHQAFNTRARSQVSSSIKEVGRRE